MKRIHRKTVQKFLNDLDDDDDVFIHLEPDILKCKVKGALGSIAMNKASEGNGISAELFHTLKDDAFKVLYSVCQQIWKTNSGQRTGKGQFSFQSEIKGMFQLLYNCTHFTC